jgi:hypothetical protein
LARQSQSCPDEHAPPQELVQLLHAVKSFLPWGYCDIQSTGQFVVPGRQLNLHRSMFKQSTFFAQADAAEQHVELMHVSHPGMK